MVIYRVVQKSDTPVLISR